MEFKSKSSNIDKAKYHPETKMLEVTFKNGTTYQYHGVSETDYLFFKEAKSHGKFLASHIKDKFKSNVKPQKKRS